MTAEIAIMNKTAVALAADSAVTIGNSERSKIYNTVNKLFMLSKYRPVGVMIFGGAEINEVPWETVIKVYRQHLGTKQFQTLVEYVNNFVQYISANKSLFPKPALDRFLSRRIRGYFHLIQADVDKTIKNKLDCGKISEQEIAEIVRIVVMKHHEKWLSKPLLEHITTQKYRQLQVAFRNNINQFRREIFQKLPRNQTINKQLQEIAVSVLCRDWFPDNTSGIVIAGFGESEEFPSVVALEIDGLTAQNFKYKVQRKNSIDFRTAAAVMPFAQSEMVGTFIEGVNPHYGNLIDSFVSDILQEYPKKIVDHLPRLAEAEKKSFVETLQTIGKALSSDFSQKLGEFRRENHISPIMDAVAVLPKDELAAMAESLVNLTSFKRRISMEAETVGGPIDVAVISKCDGFVWIKRKHYFKPELNPAFFANYYNGSRGQQ